MKVESTRTSNRRLGQVDTKSGAHATRERAAWWVASWVVLLVAAVFPAPLPSMCVYVCVLCVCVLLPPTAMGIARERSFY